jgi:hypothetical protein
VKPRKKDHPPSRIFPSKRGSIGPLKPVEPFGPPFLIPLAITDHSLHLVIELLTHRSRRAFPRQPLHLHGEPLRCVRQGWYACELPLPCAPWTAGPRAPVALRSLNIRRDSAAVRSMVVRKLLPLCAVPVVWSHGLRRRTPCLHHASRALLNLTGASPVRGLRG